MSVSNRRPIAWCWARPMENGRKSNKPRKRWIRRQTIPSACRSARCATSKCGSMIWKRRLLKPAMIVTQCGAVGVRHYGAEPKEPRVAFRQFTGARAVKMTLAPSGQKDLRGKIMDDQQWQHYVAQAKQDDQAQHTREWLKRGDAKLNLLLALFSPACFFLAFVSASRFGSRGWFFRYGCCRRFMFD